MGPILSSNKDYNRILAKLPRKSTGLSKIVVPQNFQQAPLTDSLSIPIPVRNSQLNKQTVVSSNEPLPSELNPIPIQSNSTPIIDKQPEQRQLMHRSTSFAAQPNFSPHNQSRNNDAIVLSRSVLNLNNHQRRNHNHFSSYRPNQSIIERNGKQFITESHERMEQRHVQIFDETTGRMRLFEVTDYIPSKTVRAVRTPTPFRSQSRTSQNHLPTNFSSNNRLALPPIPNNRTEPPLPPTQLPRQQLPPPAAAPPPPAPLPGQQPVAAAPPPTPSNLRDFNGLSNRETVAREFDLYHSGATLPYNNNNNTNTTTNRSHPPLATQQSTDSNYTYSQPKSYNTSTTGSQRAPNEYTSGSYRSQPGSYHSQPGPYRSQSGPHRSQSGPYRSQPGPYHSQPASYRPHTPTASDYSVNTSPDHSQHSGSESDDDTDSEGLDQTVRPTTRRDNHSRHNSDVAYGTVGGQDSPTFVDPFRKATRSRDPYYRKRSNMDNYSEPISNNRNFPKTAVSDYAPIPVSHYQSNQNRYSQRKDSNAYDG